MDVVFGRVGQGTIWKVAHLPQNRDLFATAGGNGTVNIFKYIYPPQRSHMNLEDGKAEGIMGTVEPVADMMMSTQPIHSIDWHPDKLGLGVCTAFDQCVRVLLVTKLNKL